MAHFYYKIESFKQQLCYSCAGEGGAMHLESGRLICSKSVSYIMTSITKMIYLNYT